MSKPNEQPAAGSKPASERAAPDVEMRAMSRILRILADLPAAGRQRVGSYIAARVAEEQAK